MYLRASLAAQLVKGLPAMQGTPGMTPGSGNPLEKPPTPVFWASLAQTGKNRLQRGRPGFEPWV